MVLTVEKVFCCRKLALLNGVIMFQVTVVVPQEINRGHYFLVMSGMEYSRKSYIQAFAFAYGKT